MSLFTPLRRLFGAKRDRTERGLSLTRHERETLLRLQEDPAFGIFCEILDRYAILHGDALLSPSLDHVDFERGRVAGLREAASLPERVRLEEEQKRVRERSKQRRAESDAVHRRSVTYASPAWGSAVGNGQGSGDAD